MSDTPHESSHSSSLLPLQPKQQQVLYRVIFCALLIFLLFSRLAGLAQFPARGGLFQDEAFVGYEAWSLLHYGIDSAGNPWPVILETWGSGMNAFGVYATIPSVALFGLTTYAVRLPEAVFSIIGVLALWRIGVRNGGDRFGLWLFFLGCVMPWSIITGRFGVESNMFPA